MKSLFETWNKFLLAEKLMLKPGRDGWDKYKELVAKAYKEAPMFDESAVASFEALEPFVHKMFDRIVGFGIDIDFVDDNPYENSEEMCRDVSENKILKIWKGGTDHQIFDAKTNLKLRAVHDYMAHCQGGTSFDLQGEIASYNRHMKTVPPSAAGALFTEVVGQAAFFLEYEYFPPQKIAILEGFDFFNVGEVDPEIIGYRLDRDEKKLVSVEEPPEEYTRLRVPTRAEHERMLRIARGLDEKKQEIEVQTESYQRKIRKRHRKMKIRLIGKGKNTYNVGGKMKKPSYKRAKSAPAGAGGS